MALDRRLVVCECPHCSESFDNECMACCQSPHRVWLIGKKRVSIHPDRPQQVQFLAGNPVRFASISRSDGAFTSSAAVIRTALDLVFTLGNIFFSPAQNTTCTTETKLMSRLAPNMRTSILKTWMSVGGRSSHHYLITSVCHLKVPCDVVNGEV